MEREKIIIDDLKSFGDVTSSGPWFWDNQIYDKVEKILRNNCDGECWETIIKRQSDGKYFKMDVWDNGHQYVLDGGDGSDNYIEEVFPRQTITVKYE